MRKTLVCIATALLLAAFSPLANAAPFDFTFAGTGVSGHITLTYGPATDARYSQGFKITGISGTFSDTALGLVNTPILGLEGLNLFTPEPGNILTPHDFSGYTVASGLAPEANGALHFDNLLYLGGSPAVANNYPFGGGVFDIYGLLFDIGGNRVVNLWSNGLPPGAPGVTYGVAVANHATSLDYVASGVALTQTPEPGTLCLLGTGLVAVLSKRTLFRRA